MTFRMHTAVMHWRSQNEAYLHNITRGRWLLCAGAALLTSRLLQQQLVTTRAGWTSYYGAIACDVAARQQQMWSHPTHPDSCQHDAHVQ
jgi:hypothetical protein